MDGLTCDACGRPLLVDEDARYVLRIEGVAAYDPLEITRDDLARDLRGETRAILDSLSNLDEDTAQDQVHRAFHYDLCTRCWQRYVQDPLAGLKADSEPQTD